MTLRNLLKQNETTIKELDDFFEDSFQSLKELHLKQKANPPKPPEISEIHILSKKFPLNLQINEHIKSFLQSGVLHPFENSKQKACFEEFFLSKTVERLVQRLFVLIFLHKFPEENEKINFEELKEKLGKSINRKYSKIFLRTPKANDDFQNAVIFSIGYLIHMVLFLIFPLDRAIFTIRFIFDVYHIVIFQINGLFISDYYLQTQFERIFTGKFLEYEVNKPIVSQKEENQNQNTKSSFRDKSFLISKDSSMNNENKYHDFAGELSNRLKIKQSLLRRRDSEKSINSVFIHSKSSKKSPLKKAAIFDETEQVSERMQFNCFQVSPCISSIINAPLLPHTKTKTINYSLDKSYLNRTRTFIQLYEDFQNKFQDQKKKKKPSKSLPKISSFHQNNANFINENVKIDNLEKAKKLFKHMRNLSLQLKKQEQRYSALNSSKIILENARKRSFDPQKILKEIDEDTKKKKEDATKLVEESLKPLKLGQIEGNKSMRSIRDSSVSANRIQPSSFLKPQEQELYEKPSFGLRSKSNLKALPEKDDKRIIEKLKAKVSENGEMIDINEGLDHKVKTFFMLKDDDYGDWEGKNRKKEYLNKYTKFINGNIDENIKGINRKLANLTKYPFKALQH